MLQCASSHVYIVLDALDEFANDHREDLINVVRESLGHEIYFLVTLRPDIGLDVLFEGDTTLDIEASADDIEYISETGSLKVDVLPAMSRGRVVQFCERRYLVKYRKVLWHVCYSCKLACCIY